MADFASGSLVEFKLEIWVKIHLPTQNRKQQLDTAGRQERRGWPPAVCRRRSPCRGFTFFDTPMKLSRQSNGIGLRQDRSWGSRRDVSGTRFPQVELERTKAKLLPVSCPIRSMSLR
jgi:hypothetical protein